VAVGFAAAAVAVAALALLVGPDRLVATFGHLGAEPLAALFLSRGTDAEYETSLAAVAGVDALNLFPSAGFVLVGGCYTVGQNG